MSCLSVVLHDSRDIPVPTCCRREFIDSYLVSADFLLDWVSIFISSRVDQVTSEAAQGQNLPLRASETSRKGVILRFWTHCSLKGDAI